MSVTKCYTDSSHRGTIFHFTFIHSKFIQCPEEVASFTDVVCIAFVCVHEGWLIEIFYFHNRMSVANVVLHAGLKIMAIQY